MSASVPLAIGAIEAGVWPYQSHFDAQYECRVERARHLEFGGRWVRDPGPDGVYLRNTSVMPLIIVWLLTGR